MTRAFIRMGVEVGHEKEVRDTLRHYEEVDLAEITAGEQDVIALVKGQSYEAILQFVVEKVRKIPGIKVTWTNFILD